MSHTAASGPPPDALGKCYIDILPVELLVEIMTYLAPEIDLYEPPTYEQCPPVALVIGNAVTMLYCTEILCLVISQCDTSAAMRK